MPRIDLQYLYRPTTTPEQGLLLEHFYSRFDTGAVGRTIANVEPLHAELIIAGSEFLTYNAAKLYLCYSVEFGLNVSTANEGHIAIYNEANANNGHYYNLSGIAAAINIIFCNKFELKNIWFSRIVSFEYAYMIFKGYRITLV